MQPLVTFIVSRISVFLGLPLCVSVFQSACCRDRHATRSGTFTRRDQKSAADPPLSKR